ncbi:MAG: TRAP transporter small permease subunit [Geminicoccaceae bacterium]|nr:MAG: TRAP transporter small permease subunit [Geminicoccaceae bacterium]
MPRANCRRASWRRWTRRASPTEAVLRLLDRALAGAEHLFLFLANGLLLTILAINLANILSRLLLDQGIIWVFPWTRVLFVWMVFLAFFVIYRRGKDITVDFVVNRLPDVLQRVVAVLVNLMVIALLVMILLQMPTLLPRQVGRMDLVGLQRYWLAIPFYVSCLLILLQFVLDLARTVTRRPTPAPGNP